MYNLSDSVVYVTGASAGIGAACAEAFVRAGARVLLCARRAERLDALAHRLRTTYDATVYPLPLDVRDAAAIAEAFAALPPAWQAADVLVNNAGLGRGADRVYETSADDLDAMIDTNVKGVLHMIRAVVPGMVARGHGHVINIGSVVGHEVYPNGVVYCATKHAVTAITKGLKMDLHGTAIRVSTVDPGLVETDYSLVRFAGDATRAAAVYAGLTPLSPADVADAVIYCATRPPHVNIGTLILTPTAQSAVTMIARDAPPG